jgi:hypothetical protein
MKIIGCDFHPGYQHIAVLDLATPEIVEKALNTREGRPFAFHHSVRICGFSEPAQFEQPIRIAFQ